MLQLIARSRPAERRGDYPAAVDLQELLQSPEIRANARLWFDGDDPIAYALVDDFHNLLFDCADRNLEPLGDQIIQWGLECLAGAQAQSLDATCREDDAARVAFLLAHGFEKTPAETVSMARDLGQPIPEPLLPPGFSVRSARGEQDAAALADLHRAAFGTDQVTTEVRLSWMRVPGYDPSLDLIALAPDGSFAAYCMCSIDPGENQASGKLEGRTDPVAVHPRYQKLGLARALLLTGLHLLKQRGMKTAALGTSGDNLAMQNTARSVGFVVSCKKLWFEKAIHASLDPAGGKST
jgi:ribosomal protein S18 acetylase RimI-like enzyme